MRSFAVTTANHREAGGGAADARGVVGRGPLPRVDVLKRLGEVELFERVEYPNLEAGARELLQIVCGEFGGVGEKILLERGVIPPFGSDLAD